MYEKFMNDKVNYPDYYIDYLYKKHNNFNTKNNIKNENLNRIINKSFNELKNIYKKDNLIIFTLLMSYFKNFSREFFNVHMDSRTTKAIFEQMNGCRIEDTNSIYRIELENIFNDPKINKQLYVGCENKDKSTIINDLCFVLLNSYYTSYTIDSNIFILKSGLKMSYIDNYLNNYDYNVNLNNFYTSYITEGIINNLLKYKNYNIKKRKINKFLNDLNNNNNTENYFSDNYIYIKLLCYPMLENNELTNIALNSYYGKDNNELKNYFDMRKVNFDNFNEELDKNEEDIDINYIKEKVLILGKNI